MLVCSIALRRVLIRPDVGLRLRLETHSGLRRDLGVDFPYRRTRSERCEWARGFRIWNVSADK